LCPLPIAIGRKTITGNTLKITSEDDLTEKNYKNELEFENIL
jgi:hypothetical protein